MSKKIVVIGGGISGLSSAALLKNSGYEVILLEKNNELGGRGRIWKDKGFTFDMGPSWYMMPEVFENFFGLFGKKVSDYYNLLRLDSHYKVFFPDGNVFNISKDLDINVELFESVEKGAGDKLKKYLAKSRHTYETAMQDLVMLDYKNIFKYINVGFINSLLKLDPITSFSKSFHGYVSKYFRNPELQKIIEFTTVFLGGSPYNTPAFYNLITHADFNLGIYYPDGGINKFIQALSKLCSEVGVEVHTGEEVQHITVKDRKAISIETKNKSYPADIVLSSADYHFTETKLIDKNFRTYDDNYWSNKIMSPSAFNIYLGLNQKVSKLEHHNLYFDDSWEKSFKEVYNVHKWPDNPSYYVHVPSKTDPSVAPDGSEAVFILVPVAAGLEDDDTIREIMYEKVLSHFEGLVGQSIRDSIVTKRIFSHRDFNSSYNAFKGAAFGLAHTLGQTALFRPKNFSRKIKNLYYAGQYTNPGVGMPVCLLSSQITANLIKAEN
ncbi:phytoene desaturase [Candidatus Dojkabacteria bacterium]|nr:phytoene desaturase [Candidatus Dojkabacteria bacterium]